MSKDEIVQCECGSWERRADMTQHRNENHAHQRIAELESQVEALSRKVHQQLRGRLRLHHIRDI